MTDLAKIQLRSSTIDLFLNCSWQWYHVVVLKTPTIPPARAVLGTTLHKVAENFWKEAIKTGKKDLNKSKYQDMAFEFWREEVKTGNIKFVDDEKPSDLETLAVKGSESFVDDIAQYEPIPEKVEIRLRIPIANHPLVESISGALDYLDKDTIADLKTTKTKAVFSRYKTQQSIYKHLAETAGYKIKKTKIQNLILTKQPRGQVGEVETNVNQVKYILNNILKVLRVYAQDIMPPEYLFRGNPKYYLCDERYCDLYKTCPFVNGRI